MTAGELIDDDKIKVGRIKTYKVKIDDFTFLEILWYSIKRWKLQLLVLWGVGYPLVQLLLFFQVI